MYAARSLGYLLHARTRGGVQLNMRVLVLHAAWHVNGVADVRLPSKKLGRRLDLTHLVCARSSSERQLESRSFPMLSRK